MKTKESLPSYELKLYKNLYESENKYRNDFSDRVFKTITVIISLIGSLIWLTIKFSAIYKNQCCYFQCINALLLVASYIISFSIIFLFFMYNYRDTRLDVNEIHEALIEYKQNNIDENTILLMNKTLVNSYRNATIKNSIENEKRIDMFRLTYRLILFDMIFLSAVFFIEIFF